MSSVSLQTLAQAVESIPDPRFKQGVTHSYHGMLALVLIGLIAGMPYIAHIRRWAQKHWHTLREPLKFKKTYPPVETTITRALAKTSAAASKKFSPSFSTPSSWTTTTFSPPPSTGLCQAGVWSFRSFDKTRFRGSLAFVCGKATNGSRTI